MLAAAVGSAGDGDASTLKSLPKQSQQKQGHEDDSIVFEQRKDGFMFDRQPPGLLRPSDDVEPPRNQEGTFEPLASEKETADVVNPITGERKIRRSRRDR